MSDDTDGPLEPAFEPDDLIAQLRAARDQARGEATLDLAIPGYGGRLIARYQAPERDRLGPVITAVASGSEISQGDELDLLIAACTGLFVSDGQDASTPRPLDPEGGPVRFDGGDERLSRLLGFDAVRTARDAARKTFMTDRYPLAPSGHCYRLIGWLQGLDAEIALRAEGESSAAEV